MEMPTPDARILGLKSRLVARLREVLPHDAVIDDEMQTRVYECDALTAYKCPPLCAVLPSSTQEVSAVVKVCHEEGVSVVPR
ncbi:MAG: FAD-binding oxidoreductase, partial [Boseongicola sp.]|nr:FAD-binding oxidoreductase [Boseongicola sp.]